MELLNLQVAESLYNKLKKEIKTIPEYRFNLTNIRNKSIVFQTVQPSNFYFGNIGTYAFKIYYFEPNAENLHFKQLENLEKICKVITDLKTLTIDNQEKKVLSTKINNNARASLNWVAVDLDSFDSEFQVYSLDIEINLYN